MDLATIWFVLVGVLFAGYAVLDGFDLGVGVLYPFIGKTAQERRSLRVAIGPFWDGNEVWLLTAGGALFAAFPPVYATAFSGLYLALILVLAGLIFRAVSIEFRGKDEAWAPFWDWAFFGGSLLPALLFGVAVGNMVRGVPVTPAGEYGGTFLDLLNPYALLIGVTGLAMFVTQGASWAAIRTAGALRLRAERARSIGHIVLGALVVASTVATFFAAEDHFRNNLTSVAGWLMIVLLAAGYALARGGMVRGSTVWAFIGSSISILGLVGLWAAGSYPALIPASNRPELGLTVDNAASSDLSLTVMLIIAAIGVPLVLAYTALVYRALLRRAPDEVTPQTLSAEVEGKTADTGY